MSEKIKEKVPKWFIQEMIEDLPGDDPIEDFRMVYISGIKRGRKETAKQIFDDIEKKIIFGGAYKIEWEQLKKKWVK